MKVFQYHMVNGLLNRLDYKYYVGLLSAAAYYKVADVNDHLIHIVCNKKHRDLSIGSFDLRFYAKGHINKSFNYCEIDDKTDLIISSPEMIAFDLVNFPQACNGWKNVITLLHSLAKILSPNRLIQVAEAESCLSNIQRLGYLLDTANLTFLAKPLAEWIKARKPQWLDFDKQPLTNNDKLIKNKQWCLRVPNIASDIEHG